MAFMKPEVTFMTCWHVDTTCGIVIIPESLAATGLPCHLQLEALEEFLEGTPLNPDPERFGDGIESHIGFYARLSAPGYMDCTYWQGPYRTEKEALATICEEYDVDETGESEGDTE